MLKMKKKIWVISEVYYPDEQGTAYYMTKIAEGLSKYFDVHVLCGYPTVTARGKIVPKKEFLDGVNIERCQGTTFNKDSFILRSINIFSNGLSLFIKALLRIKKGEVVLVVTGPHILHFLVKLACSIKKVRCILRVDDVYPEALIATGVLSERNLIAKILFYVNRVLYDRMDKIIVLGRDMRKLALNKINELHGALNEKVIIIPNWADIEQVYPQPKKENPLLKELGLSNLFIVQCAGNMGRAQAIENMFKAIEFLRNEKNIHFMFIGGGGKRGWMENEVQRKRLTNITILNQLPRAEQINFLNACDIAMASLLSKMTGAGVPSRMYNIMAAGKPIIAVAPLDSELSMVVQEEGIGWVVPPDQPEKLADVILMAYFNRELVTEMGDRARRVAESKYSSKKIIEQYCTFISNIINNQSPLIST